MSGRDRAFPGRGDRAGAYLRPDGASPGRRGCRGLTQISDRGSRISAGRGLGLSIIARSATASVSSQLRAGGPVADALSDGFGAGLVVSAGLLVAAAVVAILRFRDEGLGNKVGLTELAAAGTGGQCRVLFGGRMETCDPVTGMTVSRLPWLRR